MVAGAGEISAGLYIPSDFERRRLGNDRPSAQLLIDGGEPGVEGALRALATMPLRVRAADTAQPPRSLEVLTEYNPERRTAVPCSPNGASHLRESGYFANRVRDRPAQGA